MTAILSCSISTDLTAVTLLAHTASSTVMRAGHFENSEVPFQPDELEFYAEEERITIVPKISTNQLGPDGTRGYLHLLSGALACSLRRTVQAKRHLRQPLDSMPPMYRRLGQVRAQRARERTALARCRTTETQPVRDHSATMDAAGCSQRGHPAGAHRHVEFPAAPLPLRRGALPHLVPGRH